MGASHSIVRIFLLFCELSIILIIVSFINKRNNMAIIQSDKRRKELERLYAKPALRLDVQTNRRTTHPQREDDFLSTYRPTLMKDTVLSAVMLVVLILSQLILVRFLK